MSAAVFKKFRLIGKIPESRLITSFFLTPDDGTQIDEFKPGQYVTLRLPDQTVRTYTVSSSVKNRSGYRISVKREESIDGSTPPGKVSNYLHDFFEVGDLIDVLAPRGDFWLDEQSSRPVLLLSGGVGVTPMVSMLHALDNSRRKVFFIHACREGNDHAFLEEVSSFSRANLNITTVFFYRRASADDRARMDYREGAIDPEFFAELNCDLESECYLCGPPEFMKSVYAALISYGIQKNRIYYEFFGGGTSLGFDTVEAVDTHSDSNLVIELEKSRKTFNWNGFSGSILDFIDANGVSAPFSCRLGVCGTCECRVISGNVAYFAEPLDPPAEGHAYLCICKPTNGKLRLDI